MGNVGGATVRFLLGAFVYVMPAHDENRYTSRRITTNFHFIREEKRA
jgi:hypothetical protein